MMTKRTIVAFLLALALPASPIVAQSDGGESSEPSITLTSAAYIGALIAGIVAATAIGIGGSKSGGSSSPPVSP